MSTKADEDKKREEWYVKMKADEDMKEDSRTLPLFPRFLGWPPAPSRGGMHAAVPSATHAMSAGQG